MTLDYDEFLAEVQRDAEPPGQDDAVRAIRAALETLAERLSGDEVRDLPRHLPEPVRPWLHDGQVAEPFGVEEYLERLAQREGVDEGEAVRHAVAVFAALRLATGLGELRRLEAELPKDCRALLAAAEAAVEPDGGSPPAETFILRVVAYGALDPSRAWTAAEAGLEALGERLSAARPRTSPPDCPRSSPSGCAAASSARRGARRRWASRRSSSGSPSSRTSPRRARAATSAPCCWRCATSPASRSSTTRSPSCPAGIAACSGTAAPARRSAARGAAARPTSWPRR